MPEDKVEENVEVKDALDETKMYPASVIKDLREENIKHRLAKKAAQEELEKLKKEADEKQAAVLKEQGEFKKLYEESKVKLDRMAELETRLTAIDQRYTEQLEVAKKLLSEDEVKLIDDMHEVSVEKRLELAHKLAGKKQASHTDAPRGGSASTLSADAILKEYSDPKTSSYRKMQILEEIEKSNPNLYKQIIK